MTTIFNRHWQRRPWVEELASLGEEAILRHEKYLRDTPATHFVALEDGVPHSMTLDDYHDYRAKGGFWLYWSKETWDLIIQEARELIGHRHAQAADIPALVDAVKVVEDARVKSLPIDWAWRKMKRVGDYLQEQIAEACESQFGGDSDEH